MNICKVCNREYDDNGNRSADEDAQIIYGEWPGWSASLDECYSCFIHREWTEAMNDAPEPTEEEMEEFIQIDKEYRAKYEATQREEMKDIPIPF